MRLILSNKGWINVKLPVGANPFWSSSDFWYYGTVWVASIEKGFSENRSDQIAEALVNRRMYEHLVYEKSLEDDIKIVMND